MLDVSLLGVELCSVWKGMRGQWSNDKGTQRMSTPLPRLPDRRLRVVALSLVSTNRGTHLRGRGPSGNVLRLPTADVEGCRLGRTPYGDP